MPRDAFAHVEVWVFDLDNTLYPPSSALFDQIHAKMTEFICLELNLAPEDANALRADYWRRYGTTLNGLMREHKLAPEAFLEAVHDIDLAAILPAPELDAAIARLPGRKIIHTNASRAHAARVLDRLAIADHFDGVYAIEDTRYDPKPQRSAYEQVIGAGAFDPKRAAMFEDSAGNLREPHALGMRTVLAHRPADEAEAAHVHFATDDVAAFLRRLVA